MPVPDNVLSLPREGKIKYWKDEFVRRRHPNLEIAFNLVMQSLQYSNSMIFVIGPTRVGKSTLILKVQDSIAELMLPNLIDNPCLKDVIAYEVAKQTRGSFDWKNFAIELLLLLKEPQIENKKIFWEEKSNGTASRMRSLENALKNRKPIVLLDEAQHICTAGSVEKFLVNLDALKSLANKSNTKFVLFGSYELLELLRNNAQLDNRIETIHFPRYHIEVNSDKEAFCNILNTFQVNLPIEEEIDIENQYEFFYEKTIGCVGALKDWFTRALVAKLYDTNNGKSFQYHLEHTALKKSLLDLMMQEANDGEKAMRDIEGENNSQDCCQESSNETPDTTNESKNKGTGKTRTRGPVGKCAPERHTACVIGYAIYVKN